jgi:putative transposase
MYLYGAVDRDGNLVDSVLSENRAMEAAGRFFAQAKDVVGHAPERVTMDKHHPYPRAIRRTPGRKVVQREPLPEQHTAAGSSSSEAALLQGL